MVMMIVQSSTIFPALKSQDLPLRLHTPILTTTHKHTANSRSISASFQWPCATLHHPKFRLPKKFSFQIFAKERRSISISMLPRADAEFSRCLLVEEAVTLAQRNSICVSGFCSGAIFWLASAQVTLASEDTRINEVYQMGEFFELGIQLTYLLLLLALLGVGSFFVIRQVLVRRELDLSAKELQEQVRSGDASATELFELGAVMLRRKLYPVATKYLLQAIEKWDSDDQDLAQVYNALGVSYVRNEKIEKGIAQFEKAVKLQPGYVTAWNNLGDAYEKTNDFKSALKAFEEALLFDPNNKLARPRQEALKDKVKVYKGVAVKSKKS